MRTDCMILAGTSGVVYPAADVPRTAKRAGATIIEINPEPTEYTERIADLFLPLKAGAAFARLDGLVKRFNSP